MKRSTIPVVLFVLFVGLIAIGFYRGWFTLSSHGPAGGNQKVDVNLTLDRGKVQEDANAVKQNTADLVDKMTDHGAKSAEPTSPRP